MDIMSETGTANVKNKMQHSAGFKFRRKGI
jgi:hypothetical protein